MSVAQPSAPQPDPPAVARVREQIAWYDRKSQHAQRWFKWLKILQIVTAAAIPFAASLSAPVWVMGGGGALIVVLEGLQQLQQYQQNWTSYRATCEQLRHEHFLFAAGAGAYAAAANPEALLAERVEGMVSQEHSAWAANRDDANRKLAGA